MARPTKKTVDYFPHYSNHGKTLFIVEQRHGNEGYAFWFKLLEMLASSEGHVIDCNNPTTLMFLQAKTHTTEDECNEILNLLSELEAIDPELWTQKIIWSQNFVNNIADVYSNRRVEIPMKPSFYESKLIETVVSTSKSTQSKVKESKVKQINNEHFETFWESYPKKKSKKEAHKAFGKIKEEFFPEIMTALEKEKTSKQWTENEGRFIPYPATWLNQERWNDEETVIEQTMETIAREILKGANGDHDIAMHRFIVKYGGDELLKVKHIINL